MSYAGIRPKSVVNNGNQHSKIKKHTDTYNRPSKNDSSSKVVTSANGTEETNMRSNTTHFVTVNRPTFLLHINIQSIKNKLNELQYWLEEMNCSILCINEHWLKVSNLNLFVPFGYTLAASYCRTTVEHGGVLIYIKENIN